MNTKEYHSGNLVYQDITTLKQNELKELLSWRNHDSVRLMMNNSDLIPIENHLIFVEKLKTNNKSFYWIVIRKERPCGTVYLHLSKHNEAEWGYYLNPQFLGTGVGLEVAFESIKFFFDKFNLTILHGYVREHNSENLRIQEVIGFDRESGSSDEMIHFFLDKRMYQQIFVGDFKTFRKNTLKWKAK